MIYLEDQRGYNLMITLDHFKKYNISSYVKYYRL